MFNYVKKKVKAKEQIILNINEWLTSAAFVSNPFP
jgi:hypothetical protein